MTLFEIFSCVVNMSLTASAVIAVVLLARLALRRAPKIFSYALWAAVLFRLLCPVSLPSPASLLRLVDPPVYHRDGTTVTRVEYLSPERMEGPALSIQPEADTKADMKMETDMETVSVPQVTAPLPVKKTVTFRDALPYLWLTGTAGMLLYGFLSYLRFRRHLTGALAVGGNLYLVDHLDSAFVAGLFFPKIYLPSDLTEEQTAYIVAHERHHIRRLDHIAKHLSFLALCVHWFNPLVWVAFFLSGRDMEMSCDEAVIRKLGAGIRADYSESLVDLSTRRVTVAGTPLAFGESATKSRIMNLLGWKEPKKAVSFLCGIAAVTILTACAANPTTPVVVSKNDGSFDSNVIVSATENPVVGSTQAAVYTDEFTSTDKTVAFTFNINEQLPVMNNPVVEVVPHYLTGEDAKRVATALLGDVDWFEAEPTLEPEYTKEQIQEKINRWSQYANMEALSELGVSNPEDTLDIIKSFIQKYSDRYESAPSGSPKVCEWTMKKESYYAYSAESIAGQDLSDDNDEIQAVAKVGDVEYTLRVATRNMSDFKINNIYLNLWEGISPNMIDSSIYAAELCRGEKPTEEDVAEAVAKAEKMLADMDLGQWQVDSSSVENYIIKISAVPAINGVPAVRVPQIGNLKSDLAYASNYYMTNASFRFSANGDLLAFEMYSPIDTKEVINENVATKSLDELMELAKNHLMLSDLCEYGMHPDFLDAYGEELTCHVDLCQMQYGILRVKVPNTDESYYYVPGMVLYGTVDYLGIGTGQIYKSYEMKPIVALNAVDGSNIELHIS